MVEGRNKTGAIEEKGGGGLSLSKLKATYKIESAHKQIKETRLQYRKYVGQRKKNRQARLYSLFKETTSRGWSELFISVRNSSTKLSPYFLYQSNPLGPLANEFNYFKFLATISLSYAKFSTYSRRISPKYNLQAILGKVYIPGELSFKAPGNQYPFTKKHLHRPFREHCLNN